MIRLINKIKSLYQIQNDLLAYQKENNWANIYHDSIRSKKYLTELGLNVGRWAGGYPFFYLLYRVLNDVKPASILEFGLGESSKFISEYLKNELPQGRHDIIEHNEEWSSIFLTKFQLFENSQIIHSNVVDKTVNGFKYNSYQLIDKIDTNQYDLFLIDGPIGTKNYSRFDIVTLVNQFSPDKKFIIILDDTHRKGEIQTLVEILKVFENKNIQFYRADFSGLKSSTVLVSKEFEFLTSI